MFTKEEAVLLKKQGKDVAFTEKQLAQFEKGFPYINLSRVASINDGIVRFSGVELTKKAQQYDSEKDKLNSCKFVPASGAATRMFKDLHESLLVGELNEASKIFIAKRKEFAFSEQIKTVEVNHLLEFVLNEKGLNFSSLPKGLIPFHKNNKQAKTPFEEHLKEGELYGVANKKINIHFTISEQHEEKIKENIFNYVEKHPQLNYKISFSYQKKSTDTLAVDENNRPFIDGAEILFRPAGHGALLENITAISSDLIFVKNIDNVQPDRLKTDTVIYKKVLAGHLLELKNKIHSFLEELIKSPSESLLATIKEFIKKELFVDFQLKRTNIESEIQQLRKFLNRPIRVCGMVKNEGEPGGGPFWAEDTRGFDSLQIVEKSQINIKNPQQAEILNNSTHFNPVDMVVWRTDYKGDEFNLLNYRDDNTAFISLKSKNGRTLKALELPGLWNGSMADWITIFVEVPLTTFSPVKTVNDLLKPEHQGELSLA